MSATSVRLLSWRGDRLTLICNAGSPRSCHPRASAQAFANDYLQPVINSTTELAEWDTFISTNRWQGGAIATGSRGFHVVVPLRRAEVFDEVREVARGLADALAARAPERLTTAARKADRGDRVYLDVLRNAYAATAVPAYAVRPRSTAPVAVPLDWDELESAKPDGWTVRTVLDRLDRTPDPWRGFTRRARSLDAARRWLRRNQDR